MSMTVANRRMWRNGPAGQHCPDCNADLLSLIENIWVNGSGEIEGQQTRCRICEREFPEYTFQVGEHWHDWAEMSLYARIPAIFHNTRLPLRVSGDSCYSNDAEQCRQLTHVTNLPDEEINLKDAPEVLDWSNAERGKYFGMENRGAPKEEEK